VLLRIKKIDKIYLKVLKIMKKILEIAIDVSHNRVISQFEMFRNLSCTKMTKCELFFGDLKIRSTLLSFLYHSRYKIFPIKFLHGCEIHYYLLLEKNHNFLELVNIIFNNLNAQEHWSSGAKNLHSSSTP
jgi:hypothetical protein